MKLSTHKMLLLICFGACMIAIGGRWWCERRSTVSSSVVPVQGSGRIRYESNWNTYLTDTILNDFPNHSKIPEKCTK